MWGSICCFVRSNVLCHLDSLKQDNDSSLQHKYYYFYPGYTMFAARMVFRASMCCLIYTQIPSDLLGFRAGHMVFCVI